MNRYLLRIGLIACLLFHNLICIATADSDWDQGIDDTAFRRVIKTLKDNPIDLSRHADLISLASKSQLSQVVDALDTSHFTFTYPVAIKGYEINDLCGMPLKSLSLIAFHDNRLIPIPFQFDELDINGLIYIHGISRDPISGEMGILDKEDELLFMYRDASLVRYDPVTMPELPQGKVVKEITLIPQNGKNRFVYLVKDYPERSKADYVSMDISKGIIDSTFYCMEYDVENISRFKKMTVKVGPEQGKDLIDSVFFQVSTGVFTDLFRVSLNSVDNIKSTPLAVKDGPIRATAIVEIKVYVGNLPFYRDRFNFSFYELCMNFRSRFIFEGVGAAKYLVYILKKPKLEVFIDFNNLTGAKFSNQAMHSDNFAYAIVDGKMGPFEKEINKRRLPGDWLWMDSNRSWELFISNHLPVVHEGLFDAFLEGMTITLQIEDNPKSNIKYERYPGANPRFGVTIEGLPTVLLNLMSATKDVPMDQNTTFSNWIDIMIHLDKEGKLEKLDNIVQDVLIDLKKKGKIKSNTELADAFIADFERIGFTGVDRKTINKLIRLSTQHIKSFDTFSSGKMLVDFKHYAKEMNVNLNDLHSKPMDNTIFFIDSVGENGPQEFFEEASNPPIINIQPFNKVAISN